jgi:hypothetical protein
MSDTLQLTWGAQEMSSDALSAEQGVRVPVHAPPSPRTQPSQWPELQPMAAPHWAHVRVELSPVQVRPGLHPGQPSHTPVHELQLCGVPTHAPDAGVVEHPGH